MIICRPLVQVVVRVVRLRQRRTIPRERKARAIAPRGDLRLAVVVHRVVLDDRAGIGPGVSLALAEGLVDRRSDIIDPVRGRPSYLSDQHTVKPKFIFLFCPTLFSLT